MAENQNNQFSEDVRQHLSFIEGVITRMNSNSFSMKGWMVAIVSALCAVCAGSTASSNSKILLYIAIFVILIFWGLDAYYLKKERQYRELYKDVVNRKTITDFNMDARKYHQCYWAALWSSSCWILYTSVVVVLVIALLLLK